MQKAILLSDSELTLRLSKVTAAMSVAGLESILLSDNASKYYMTGRVFAGYIYITADGKLICFVQRPVELEGPDVIYIRKPEDIPAHVAAPSSWGLELNTTSWVTVERLRALFPEASVGNASSVMMQARSVKTEAELELIRLSGRKQETVYRRIPRLYREGMTDIEFQVEIERASRLEGCLGQFRISGDTMELFMGNIIAGDNADAPSPYDFAMGGAGLDPSLPVGANGTIIKPGMAVMVDVNGNYTGYMTDMTRVFSLGRLTDEALKAHDCSIRIHRALAAAGAIGTPARELYEMAVGIAAEDGLEHYFMGHRQHAKFIGHGLGIEINELPVIAPRSHDTISAGQVIALEPKFVIPGTGAVGIENTYYITPEGRWECLTNAPEAIIPL
ncbi:MAG: Xaa-Pro peptidase family protein [Muribaculaceae bacterium]|nr:Xaa-Pro peptidase family protein [Muribaculaceae bacterium]